MITNGVSMVSIALVSAALLAPRPLAAFEPPGFWWYVIHCTGAEDHGGTQVALEPNYDNVTGQCHGNPGDGGGCVVVFPPSQGGTFSVVCWQAGVQGQSLPRCSAYYECPDGTTLQCSGPGPAYAGRLVTEEAGTYGFVKCEAGDLVAHHACRLD
jgi:hypothetical protein